MDSLAVIFPFEVECYQDVDLPVSFVGHPFVTSEYKSPVHYDKQGSLLLLPGSRLQPIQRILPVFLDATEKLAQSYPHLKIEVPVPGTQIRRCVEQIISTKPTLQDRIVIKEGLHDLKHGNDEFRDNVLFLCLGWNYGLSHENAHYLFDR